MLPWFQPVNTPEVIVFVRVGTWTAACADGPVVDVPVVDVPVVGAPVVDAPEVDAPEVDDALPPPPPQAANNDVIATVATIVASFLGPDFIFCFTFS